MIHRICQVLVARTCLFSFFISLFILFQQAQPAAGQTLPNQTADEKLALTNVTLIDGRGRRPKTNQTLIVAGGRITDIFTSRGNKIVPGARVVDLSGKFVIPGLVDSHVHLATQERAPGFMQGILRNALFGGVTTVRDMGGNGVVLVALADEAKNGLTPSPRIYYSSLIIGADSSFWMTDAKGKFVSNGMPPGKTVWFRQVAAGMDIVKIISESKAFGATGIKIHSGAGPQLLEQLALEAHRRGLKVWSHSTVAPSQAIDAVEAGVDVLSHADGVSVRQAEIPMTGDGNQFFAASEANNEPRALAPVRMPVQSESVTKLLKRMNRKGTVLEPTLFIMALFEANATDPIKKLGFKSSFDYGCPLTRRANEMGVPIVTGSDNLGGTSPNLHSELQLLVKCGLTPLEVITAATRNGARVLGIEKDYGTLEIGKVADLVVLSANPAADIRNTQAVEYVMQAGKLYKSERPLRTPPLAEPPPGAANTNNN
jgi:imidazolonepropionase-like amidohydrolase